MQRQHQPAAVWLTETGTNKIGVVNPRSGARCGSAGSNLSMPQPGTWTATCPMEINRVLPTMTRLSSGKVLVTGGCDGDDYFYGSCSKDSLASAELYAPSTGRWTPTSSMGTRRSGQTATLLPDGHVLVSGGCLNACTTVLNTAELYDPHTGTWKPTSSMTTARLGQTATLLLNGQVLFRGGATVRPACMDVLTFWQVPNCTIPARKRGAQPAR